MLRWLEKDVNTFCFKSNFPKARYLEEVLASISLSEASGEVVSGFCPAPYRPLDHAVSAVSFLADGLLDCNIFHCWSVAVLCILCKIKSNTRFHFVLLCLCLLCQCRVHVAPWSLVGILNNTSSLQQVFYLTRYFYMKWSWWLHVRWCGTGGF